MPTSTLPADIAVADGWRVLADGVDSGVRWFFSQGSDPTMGTCRAFDSEPSLRAHPPRDPREPTVDVGGGDMVCSSGRLLVPAAGGSVGSAPDVVMFVRVARSDAGDFSVVAGATAPEVSSVTFHYSGGADAEVTPTSSHVFVVISRPARTPPASFDARWPGGKVACTYYSETDYRCTPPQAVAETP
jgi:hypothetical protein